MLEQVTPVLLTYNEAPNIARALARLDWAQDIVVVDSGSDDGTLELLRANPRVRVFARAFDSHAHQWNFAIAETGIRTPWVLALDADYILPEAFVAALAGLRPEAGTAGYRARFEYVVLGRALWGSLYPPVTVLFRREGARYEQDGHTQRVQLTGSIGELAGTIQHDDRKPLAHWRAAQWRYAALEARKLLATSWRVLGRNDRIRRLLVVAPLAVPFYCLVLRGGLLQGRAGWYYAMQRTYVEVLLSLQMIKVLARGAA